MVFCLYCCLVSLSLFLLYTTAFAVYTHTSFSILSFTFCLLCHLLLPSSTILYVLVLSYYWRRDGLDTVPHNINLLLTLPAYRANAGRTTTQRACAHCGTPGASGTITAHTARARALPRRRYQLRQTAVVTYYTAGRRHSLGLTT